MNKNEDKLENVFYGMLKFLYYYPFVISVLTLILYYFNINNFLIITSILLGIDFVIRFFKGEYKISVIVYILCILLSYFILKKEILDSLLIGISVGNIVLILLNNLVWRFISFMIRKFN